MHQNIVGENTDRLVEDHLWLAEMLARRLARRIKNRVEFDDLYQLGCLGLMNAAKRFDPTRGARFSTFAHMHIHGEMHDFLCKHSHHRPGRKGRSKAQPKVSLVSIDTGLDGWGHQNRGSFAYGSADQFAGDGGNQAFRLERELMARDLLEKSDLTERESSILRERYWNGWNRYQSAEVHGCHYTRIIQLEREAIAKLAA